MTPQGVTAEVKQVLYHWWDRAESDAGASHFGVTVQVLIGSTDRDEADSFHGIVCSLSMFAERFDLTQWGSDFAGDVLPGGEVLPVHGVWLMRAWSPAAFEAAVGRLVTASSPGPDWATVAERISRHLPWEYDYRRDDELNQRSGLPRLAHSFWHDAYRT